MDNARLHAVIQCLDLKNLSSKEVHEDMVGTLGEGVPSLSMVRKWVAEFKRGRVSLEDDPHPERSITMGIKKTIDKIHDMILADRRIELPYIATQLGISHERVHAIIHNETKMTKVSTYWVPKPLD